MTQITHKKAQSLLQIANDKALKEDERAALELHLSTCHACRIYAKQLDVVQDRIKLSMHNHWPKQSIKLSGPIIQKNSRRIAMYNKIVSTTGVFVMIAALVFGFSFAVNNFGFREKVVGSDSKTTPTSSATIQAKPTEGARGKVSSTPTPDFLLVGPGNCPGSFENAPGTGKFEWPLPQHYLSGQDYSPLSNHYGIDIAGNLDEAVYAADSGIVVYAGWNDTGYGNLIVIDHAYGLQSLYAHLSAINVKCGQTVRQNDTIGKVGQTGDVTTPQLHFDLRSLGKPVNPWNFLPPP
jgi:hypothetical protein